MIIIDDVVSKELQDEIEAKALGSEIQWTFARSVFYDKNMYPEIEQSQKKRLMAFTKLLMDHQQNKIDPLFEFFLQPLKAAKYTHNHPMQKILNSRIQLQMPLSVNQDRPYGMPHVDAHRNYKFKVGVYYINDVDGDTVLFKQTTNDTTPEEVKDGKLEVYQTITPKKGRLVIFDGDIYHAVGKPKTDLRCIVNYNFV